MSDAAGTESDRAVRRRTSTAARRPVGRPVKEGPRTRQAILEAAAILMARLGYDAMTLDDVATMSQVTRPAIYNYFRSKRELAQEVLRGSGDSLRTARQEAVDAEPTLAGKLRAILRVCLDASFENPASTIGYLGVAKAARDDAEMARLFKARSTVMRSFIQDVIESAIRDGLASPDIDVRDLVEATSGLVWAVSAGAADAPSKRVRNQIARGIEQLFSDDLLIAR